MHPELAQLLHELRIVFRALNAQPPAELLEAGRELSKQRHPSRRRLRIVRETDEQQS